MSLSPSAWPERLTLAALATVGLGVSGYLGLYQLGVFSTVADPVFGSASSHAVLHSSFSESLPVPDALLGAANYAVEIVLDLIGGTDRWRRRPWLVLAFGVPITAGAIVSLGLIAMQAIVVGQFCTLCLTSAAISIAVWLLGMREVVAAVGVVLDRGGEVTARRRQTAG